MPIMRVKEIRDMNPADRTKKLGELRTELLRLNTMIKAGGMVENPARIKHLRRTIARILTIESEKKRMQKQEKAKAEAEPKKKVKKAGKAKKGEKAEK